MSRLEFPRHAALHGFDVESGALRMAGVPLGRIAARVGRTPFYAYSRDLIADRVSRLRAALPPAVRLHYAVKANPMPAVVHFLAQRVDGLDVASATEMHLALGTGTSAADISFAGPGKTAVEIRQAVASGVTINLESETQYRLALAAAESLGLPPSLAIRINPAFELKSSGMKMGGGPKPFGIDEAQVPDLLAAMKADGVRPVGFHLFSGSQNLQTEAIVDSQRKAVDLVARLAARCDCAPSWINVGGGLGVPYFPGEQPVDLDAIGAGLQPLAEQAERELSAVLILELGRYLVAEAGIYVARVIDTKMSQGERFVVVDGGLHHNLAVSGNFGQVIRKNYPVVIGNRMGESDVGVQQVVGPLCTPLDLLASRVELPVAKVDDLFVVFRVGAYGPSASPLGFLSHPAPAEILL